MGYKFNPFTGNLDITPFSLDGAGKIPSDYLPSYVDDVVEYDDLASFPGTGETGKIYVAKDTGYTYRWTGSVYVRIGSGGEVALNLGSAASPSLYFTGDPNTGIYSPGADQLALSTNGVQRISIGSDGDINIDNGGVFYDATNNRLAIGTTSPETRLHTSIDSAVEWTSGANLSNPANIPNVALYLSNEDTSITGTEVSLLFSAGGSGSGQHSIAVKRSGANAGDLIFRRRSGGSSSDESLRIDSSGRLLVGTSSDSGDTTLVLQGNSAGNTGTPTIAFKRNILPAVNNDIAIISFSNVTGGEGARLLVEADGAWTNGSSHPSRLVFSVTADGASSPTERMGIRNNGEIGTFSNSQYPFVVRSANVAGTGNSVIAATYSATGTDDGTLSFQVLTNGDVQNTNNSYGAISDIKLKENIVDASSQWDDLKALQVRKYNFKEGQTHTQIGLVAQEVELVSPGLVSESSDRDEDGNDLGTVTKSVNYSVLYMKAVKALQEAMERIEQLEAEMAEVKAQLS